MLLGLPLRDLALHGLQLGEALPLHLVEPELDEPRVRLQPRDEDVLDGVGPALRLLDLEEQLPQRGLLLRDVDDELVDLLEGLYRLIDGGGDLEQVLLARASGACGGELRDLDAHDVLALEGELVHLGDAHGLVLQPERAHEHLGVVDPLVAADELGLEPAPEAGHRLADREELEDQRGPLQLQELQPLPGDRYPAYRPEVFHSRRANVDSAWQSLWPPSW